MARIIDIPRNHPFRLDDLLGQRLLVVGAINAGKTTLCARWLRLLVEKGHEEKIAVLDLAPEIPQKDDCRGIGGHLPSFPGVQIHRPSLRPPRLSAKTIEESLAIAAENAECIRRQFQEVAAAKKSILVVNDLSMFLQAGYSSEFIDFQKGFSTVLANAYYGNYFPETDLTLRERRRTYELFPTFSQVYHLNVISPAS